MSKKRKCIKFLLILVGVLVIIYLIPMLIINEPYNYGLTHMPLYTTVWDGKDALMFYDSLVGAEGIIWGVYFPIKVAYKNHQDDVRNRSLPFFALDVFNCPLEIAEEL